MKFNKIKKTIFILLFFISSSVNSQDVEKMGKKELRVAFTELTRQIDSLKVELTNCTKEKLLLNNSISETTGKNNSLNLQLEQLAVKEREHINKIADLESKLKALSSRETSNNVISKTEFEQLTRKTLIDKYLAGKKFILKHYKSLYSGSNNTSIALVNETYYKEESLIPKNNEAGDFRSVKTNIVKASERNNSEYKKWYIEIDSNYNFVYQNLSQRVKGKINIKDIEWTIDGIDSSYNARISVLYENDKIKIPLLLGDNSNGFDENGALIYFSIGNNNYFFNNKELLCPICVMITTNHSIEIFTDNSINNK